MVKSKTCIFVDGEQVELDLFVPCGRMFAGDILEVAYNGKKYRLQVERVQPESALVTHLYLKKLR